MRTKQKRVEMIDGIVTEVLRGSNSVQVEVNSGYYDKNAKSYVTEPVTMRIDNPAQVEGLEAGTKVAIFKTSDGKTNLVRNGEWKASDAIMETAKNGKSYDNGVTVIMGRCVSANLVTPKEGQTFSPFLSLWVVTNDHVSHQITINNREPYNKDDIEKAMERFKDYLASDAHGFVPFTGTFVTGNSYKQSENDREVNGKSYHNVERSYSGLLTLGSYQDYEKAPERTYSANRDEAQAEAENTSMDMNAELDYDEEIPFD